MLGDFCHQISPLAWLGRIEQVLDNDRMKMVSSRSNASGIIWMGSITKGFGEGNLIRQGENPVSIASVTQYRKLHNYSLRRMSRQTNIYSERMVSKLILCSQLWFGFILHMWNRVRMSNRGMYTPLNFLNFGFKMEKAACHNSICCCEKLSTNKSIKRQVNKPYNESIKKQKDFWIIWMKRIKNPTDCSENPFQWRTWHFL